MLLPRTVLNGLAPCGLARVVEFALFECEVVFVHHGDELFEVDAWGPSELFFGFGRVTDEEVNFGGSVEAGVMVDEWFPAVVAGDAEGDFEEFTDGVGFSGGDDVVVGGVLLQHAPHGVDIVAGVSPVAFGVKVAERDGVLDSEFDACEGVCDFAGNEFDAALGPFMVEEDAGAGVEVVGLAVVHGHVVTEDFGDAVGGAGVEGGEFGLWGFSYFAEHFGGGGLVEADGVVFHAADDAYCFEHAEHAESGDVAGEFGLFEGKLYEGDGPEVVDLVGLDLFDAGDEGGEVLEVASDEFQAGDFFPDHFGFRVVLPADHAEDLVSLSDE